MEQAKVDELFGKGPIVQPEASYAAAIRLDTSVAMSYIKAMGGTINFESAVGRGTRVSITFAFPIAYSRKNEDPAETVDNARILVADDHALSRSIAEKMLTRAGYAVVCAEDGKDAVEKFIAADGGFSLILMDIRMPVLDGLSAARTIRELKLPNAKTVPILAMTASAFEEDIRNSLEAGMNEHLSKPINPRNLYEIVEKYIHPKR
jgi:CheY-like chemotaxis protein